MAQDMNLNLIHIVAESTNILSTNFGGGHIYSITIGEDMDNGLLVCRDEYIGDETWSAKDYVAGDVACLVLTPPFAYNGKKYQSEEKFFFNAEGEIARAYELHIGDIYTISEAGLVGTPAIGSFIDATNTVSESASESGFVGEIIDEVIYSNGMAYRVLVKAL